MSAPDRATLLDELQQHLGHRFADPALLRTALTHPSWANEHDSEHNQRLEFLGDAILEAVITHHLYERYPSLSEGELSSIKHHLVSGATLSKIGRALGLSSLLRVGTGARRKSVHHNPAMLEDATEALIGALFLDAGFVATTRIVLPWFQPFMDVTERTERKAESAKNDTTRLHEACARKPVRARAHSVLLRRAGTAHEPLFHIGWWCGGELLASAWGPKKKTAERSAAKASLERLTALVDQGWVPDRDATPPESVDDTPPAPDDAATASP